MQIFWRVTTEVMKGVGHFMTQASGQEKRRGVDFFKVSIVLSGLGYGICKC